MGARARYVAALRDPCVRLEDHSRATSVLAEAIYEAQDKLPSVGVVCVHFGVQGLAPSLRYLR